MRQLVHDRAGSLALTESNVVVIKQLCSDQGQAATASQQKEQLYSVIDFPLDS